jgi:cell division protein FtsI (penicillin-binding protein 3)
MKWRTRGIHLPGRHRVLVALVGAAVLTLCWGALDLQLTQQAFLQDHANARHVRLATVPARRGLITDRNGDPLAVSTEVHSVHAHPATLLGARAQWPALCELLGMSSEQLEALLEPRRRREFVWLKRRLEPQVAAGVMALRIPGVDIKPEVRRYYPTAEVAAQLIGITDIDDSGQEGLELALDARLRGEAGRMKVLKNGRGKVIDEIESLAVPRPGEDIALSIDRRLQHVAYRELKSAVLAHRARGGIVLLMDAVTGEVLALVNQPSFNPNNRSSLLGSRNVNRALLDVFEPGSTLKPFTVATALEDGLFRPDTEFDTSPGVFRIGRSSVKDVHNYGKLDITGVIVKSSNVGTARIALALEPQRLWQSLHDLGFGNPTTTGFPGERSGYLAGPKGWREFQQATISFGYGISVTAVQLAQAYTALARDGTWVPATLERAAAPATGVRAFSPATAASVRDMLEAVVLRGTAQLARVPGYRTGGKTGTVHKTEPGGGYSKDRYLSLFAGMAPMSAPRLVAVVVVDEPQGGEYFGGRVAAPVFSRLMTEALRLLDIAPDRLEQRTPPTVAGLDPDFAAEAGWSVAQ